MEKKYQPMLVVVSLLTGKGPTGVETHFNLILKCADNKGIETLLVIPHDAHWFWRKIPNGIGRLLKLFNPEYAAMWNRMVSYRRLRRTLQFVLAQNVGRFVALYAQDPLSAAAALDARKSSRCRVVAVSHFNVSEASEMAVKGLTSEGGLLWRALMRTERSSLPRVDQLIFVSRFMSRVVNQRLPQLSQVSQVVIPNFSPTPINVSGDYIKLAGDLIAIGTLEPRKNQGYLLRVLAACSKRGRIYQLTLVGDGPDRECLVHLAKQLGVYEQVNFLGFIKNAASLMSSHRIFVHASMMESFGIVIVEALARGLPVISSAVGGIPEIITEGVEGYFWNLDDPEGGADILISLLEDPIRLKKMSYQAKQTFQNRFHPDTLSEKWMTAIAG
ncbi:MAG: glycosyltransferase family 4 protein [Glaciimonas sp.]|nr:glycosyltransferase family 4 protein [Glaciimonas sp.]